MRNELENIERIEKYLRNELGAEDKVAFEEQLKSDQTLQNQVEKQKNTVEGIERLGAKESIQTAHKGYKMRKTGFNLGLGGLLIVAITAGIVWADKPSPSISTASAEKTESTQAQEEFKVSEAFTANILSYEVDPTEGTHLKIGSDGTVLHIPESAFIDENGTTVTEPVTITFQEYKDAADMAFSQIPMTYTEGAEEYNFNSSGMFSIKGYSGGKEVAINPDTPLSIDYALAKQNPDIDFYRLKDDASNWDLVQEIDELQTLKDTLVEVQTEQNTASRTDPAPAIKTNQATSSHPLTSNRGGSTVVIPVPENSQPSNAELGNNDSVANWNPNIVAGNVFAAGSFPNNGAPTDNGDRSTGTMMAPGAGAGHTYPPVIAALNIPSFGVYNCDQIYRVPNRVNISSVYIDEQGNTIDDATMISLIDLKYNGAFSFSADNFICDSKGNNVILLFTYSRELYLLETGNFEKMNIVNNGTYTFKMKNVTETLKSTRDIRAYLGF